MKKITRKDNIYTAIIQEFLVKIYLFNYITLPL